MRRSTPYVHLLLAVVSFAASPIAAWAATHSGCRVDAARRPEGPRPLCWCGVQSEDRADELAAAIEHWASFLARSDCMREDFQQVRQAGEPVAAIAARSLAGGRRLAALYRLASLQDLVGGMEYELAHLGEDALDLAKVEATWQQEQKALGDSLMPIDAQAFAQVRPLAVRAIAEAAAGQVRGYFEASLDYARATIPETGLYYIGAARAERDLAALARRLHEVTHGEPPTLRRIAGDIDDLERELLAAYLPPASLARNREFISAHSALQDARTFDAAGLRAAALLRYLQGAVRAAALLQDKGEGDRAALQRRLAALREQATVDDVDHSIALMLLEVAEVELEMAKDGAPTPAAVGVAWALPRYFAALQPSADHAQPRAELTVTLVRWPFT